eukprot:366499-Chlamydomonas_euryale.AAC.7
MRMNVSRVAGVVLHPLKKGTWYSEGNLQLGLISQGLMFHLGKACHHSEAALRSNPQMPQQCDQATALRQLVVCHEAALRKLPVCREAASRKLPVCSEAALRLPWRCLGAIAGMSSQGLQRAAACRLPD